MKIQTKYFGSIALIAFIMIPGFAQGAPPATPIDGGLSLLLAAGGVFGIKKIRDHYRK
ncbi:PID-CTERM protein-sorting domain-containing protein [Marinoscillum sp.]|uniref:PID-CTERM protein-sorting domain-containing protein n=1 Tax=Marinoscillum sp. TaxID=2024838 RepID=UPI003BAC525E